MTATAIPADLQPVEPSYRNALRARAATFWGPLFIAAWVINGILGDRTSVPGLLPVVVGLVGLSGILVAPDRIYSMEDMAKGDCIFAATGVTDGSMLDGVKRKKGGCVTTESIVMRASTGTVRRVSTEYHKPL